MKKIGLFFLLVLTMFSFVSCNKKEYKVNLTSDSVLIEELKSSYAKDTVVELKLYPTMDVGTYVFVNDEEIFMDTSITEYLSFSFTMPNEDVEIVVTHDEYYGKDVYKIKDLFTELSNITADDIVGIKKEKKYLGVEPSTFTNVSRSSDPEDIASFIEFINSEVVRVSNEAFDGGSRFTYQIICKNATLSLEISSSRIYINDFMNSNCFLVKETSYLSTDFTNPEVNANGFRVANGVLYKADETKLGDLDILDELEFNATTKVFDDSQLKYYITSQMATIYVYNDTVFKFNEEFYELTGAFTFASLEISLQN